MKIISHKNILKMENFSLDQIEQFLKIDQEILGSADHIIFSQKGIFDDIDGEGITLLTTKTQG